MVDTGGSFLRMLVLIVRIDDCSSTWWSLRQKTDPIEAGVTCNSARAVSLCTSRAPKRIDHAADRQRLLDQFELITEEELALLLDVEVKTLRNRDQRDLPPFTKGGNKRLFFRSDVLKFLKRRTND